MIFIVFLRTPCLKVAIVYIPGVRSSVQESGPTHRSLEWMDSLFLLASELSGLVYISRHFLETRPIMPCLFSSLSAYSHCDDYGLSWVRNLLSFTWLTFCWDTAADPLAAWSFVLGSSMLNTGFYWSLVSIIISLHMVESQMQRGTLFTEMRSKYDLHFVGFVCLLACLVELRGKKNPKAMNRAS